MAAPYDGCVCGSQHCPSDRWSATERESDRWSATERALCVSDCASDARFSLRSASETGLYNVDGGADPASGGSVIEVTP
jgi:hypothetical protein